MVDPRTIARTTLPLSDNQVSLLKEQVPGEIYSQLEAADGLQGQRFWTYMPSTSTADLQAPLKVEDIPVIIPVSFRYPLRNPMVPPPDPHPQFISPLRYLTDDTVNKILEVFECALGFYLLVNGWLQIIVPDDFDYAYSLSHRPNEFGGLKVSYIPQSLTPTADRHAVNDSASSTSVVLREDIGGRQDNADTLPPYSHISRPNTANNSGTPKVGSRISIRIGKSRFEERVEAAIGVATSAHNKLYVTVPTHAITEAMKLSSLRDLIGDRKAKVMFGNQEVRSVKWGHHGFFLFLTRTSSEL